MNLENVRIVQTQIQRWVTELTEIFTQRYSSFINTDITGKTDAQTSLQNWKKMQNMVEEFWQNFQLFKRPEVGTLHCWLFERP